ncbi:MAG: DNA polymerase III subunit gamma/tau [Fuerstiella sp.]
MTDGSHYTVLARRFRPQAFDDVVGQEHVAQALRNAIRSGRVAHAYLFTGARGVGKTSTARILAKALNCPNVQDGVPCNACEICDGISAGNDVDVLEIDGASNRGIDDIRSLRANVNVRSMRTKFKLYIIDEVHMLTREAFNALLKTLEEPPPNVKFVFCTTEPNKVPDTILSRCQRFDFSAIGEASIGQRLKEIATAEGFVVDDEAVELVARRARGSMRDSQSLFDQLLAFSDGTIKAEDVHRMLGTASDDMLVTLFEAITQHRPGEVLNSLEAALNSGVQAGELLDQCVGYVRDQMITLAGGASVPLCSVGGSRRETVQQQAEALGLPNVMAAFQILSEAKGRMLRSTFARILLEMALVQISLLENLTAISSLLSGKLPALPDQAAGNATGGATAAGVPAQQTEAAEAAEKKNSPETAELTNTGAATAQDSGPELEFAPENATRILAEVVAETGFTLSSALKAIKSIAISGPNGLEIQLDASYDFQRRVIEQPESRSAIQSIVARLTGVDPVVTLTLVAGVSPEGKSTSADPKPVVPARTAESRTKPPAQVKGPSPLRIREDIDPEQDAFVQQVVETFGAKVVRITDAPARRQATEEDGP